VSSYGKSRPSRERLNKGNILSSLVTSSPLLKVLCLSFCLETVKLVIPTIPDTESLQHHILHKIQNYDLRGKFAYM